MLFCPLESTTMIAVPVADESVLTCDVSTLFFCRFCVSVGPNEFIPNATNHCNRCSLPGSSDSLIGSLSPRNNCQVFAADGFARRRKTRRADDQIGVQTSDDDDVSHSIH